MPGAERQAFVGGLLDELQRLAAAACRGRMSPEPIDPKSVCSAALTRVLERMYLAFDTAGHASHSFCRRIFAVAVRDELVERARKRSALKHGGEYHRQPFDRVVDALEDRHGPLVELTDAIDHLRLTHPARADIVTMRVFADLTFREIGETVGLDESSVRKQFKLAQAQLWRALGGDS